MTLRHLVRKAIQAGTAEYADVEAIYGGMATVRLVGSSHRLTNIPYFGDVTVGNRVMVNRGTDEPFAYAFVGLEDLPEERIEAPIRGETYDPLGGLHVGRVWHSEDKEDWCAHFYSGSTTFTSLYRQPFDTVVYNPQNLDTFLPKEDSATAYDIHGFRTRVAGTYFIRCTLGIETDEPHEWRWHIYARLTLHNWTADHSDAINPPRWGLASYYDTPARHIRNFSPIGNVTTFTVSTMMRLRANQAMQIRYYFRNNHRASSPTYRTQYNYIKSVSEEGKYPYLEWALIAPTDETNEKAVPFWWNDWPYT
jgi:hypothetical protein